MGHVLRSGGQLYLDVADRKPPLVPYLYAAVFAVCGHDSLIAVHILAIVWIAATALVIAKLADTGWAAVLFVAAHVAMLPADAMAANFEIFMLLPACLGLLLARRGDAFAAGACIALATLCKQTAGVTLIPALYHGRRPSLSAGFAITLATFALAVGPRELWFWSVAGNGGYVAGVGGFALRNFALALAVFLGGNLALCVLAARRSRAPVDLWIWLGASFLGVAAGLRFFGHYFLQLLPPLCVLAGPVLRDLARRRLALAALAIPALGGMAMGFFSARIHGMPDYAPLAAYVRANTAPADRIAIWGHYPEVHWASGRMPAWRFVHTGFLTGASSGRPGASAATPGAWSMLIEDVTRHPPRLLLDTSTAALRDYERYPPSRYPALLALLASYDAIDVVDGVTIYRQR